MSDDRPSASSQDAAQTDRERINAGLNSEEWQRSLAAARARRAAVLERRAAQKPDPAPDLARMEEADPPPPDAVSWESKLKLARQDRHGRPSSDPAPPRSMTLSVPRLGAQTDHRRRYWLLATATAVALCGLWLWDTTRPAVQAEATAPPMTLADPIPPQAFSLVPIDIPQAAGPTAAADEQAASDIQLSFGLPPVGLRGAENGPYPPPPVTDTRPPKPSAPGKLDQRLRVLAAIAPPGTRVHLPASTDVTRSIDGLTLLPSPFDTGADIVRYYHTADQQVAQDSAAAINAEAVDFSDYAPLPAPGTIEVWIGAS